MPTRDEKHMAFTKRLAINNNMKMKLAASLVIRNEVICIGVNSDKTHPIQKRFSKNSESIFKHAEIDCIINALRLVDKEDLSKATLYVARVKRKAKGDKNWVEGSAKPCPGCTQAIEYFGIKRIVYTTDKDGIYGVE